MTIISHGAMSAEIRPVTADRPVGSPWRAGLATGIGSLPGSDPGESAALLAGELPDLPHLVELPERGVGADMIGRALAICVDLPAEVTPFGWRLTGRPGRDIRRATDLLRWDLDAAEEHYAGTPWVKLQVTGPWTLAGLIETPQGNRVLTDSGALRDLADSLAEGIAAHMADVSRRLPSAQVVIQIDEPSLPAVLAGTLPTASGFGRVAAVPAPEAERVLAELVDSLGGVPSVAHCCHADIPLALLRRAGFGAISLDLSASMTLSAGRLDALGEAIEADTVLLAGLVPAVDPARGGDGVAGGDARDTPLDRAGRDASSDAARPDFRAVAAPVLDLWHRLGLPDRRLDQVVVTPTCGLAGATPRWARTALVLARDAARLLADRALG